jgi:hypothetical protein
MVECKCCGRSISPKAQTCPQCGEPAPPAPPAPLTIWNVFEAFGVDKPMAVCLAAVFFGAGAATWVFYGLNDSHHRQEQAAQAAEQDRKDPQTMRRWAAQPSPAREERQSANEPPPRR